jgi:phage terminase large subunit-like protein
MMRMRPQLMQRLGVTVNAHAIIGKKNGGFYRSLSSQSNSLDGLNLHFGCLDELHAHKGREIYDVLETALGKRVQSFLWAITTAGSNRSGICYEVRDYVIKILKKTVFDDSVFGVIYTIDDDDVWTEERSWIKANPNWGISVQPDVIGQLAAKAMQMPSAVNNFLTKHLDVWVSADSSWMDMRHWNACADESLSEEDFYGEECIIGLDLASKVDMAAKVRVFRRMKEDVAHYYVFGTYYLPEQAIVEGKNSQYSGWERMGLLRVTAGDVIDIDQIEADIKSEASAYQVRDVAYDPFQATQLSNRLTADGFNMVEVRPTVLNFSEPMKEIDALVRKGRLHHNGDPVLAWMVSNVVCHIDVKDNIYPRKERPENKIDGVVALIMAIARWTVGEDECNIDSFINNPVIG